MNHELNGIEGVPAIAAAYGMNRNTLYTRLRKGMSLEEAVSTEVKVVASSAKPKAKANPKTEAQKKTIGLRKPSLHPLWRLALGMAA
ncbi:hypothetical protein L3Q72_06550 [Vibrio sp. JC009]|uniref:hypothetical protein n=1 Tax=Vibrio sp. JC009 TaxID=2912314 RepID=UPI0023AF6415|nr:hypothetical protein [Vibrio sp. JC009]WED23049.1 hypothetical protein L3Q72_06550 [Vibrio sp. JC009]